MALSWKPAEKQLWSLSLFQHVQGNLFFFEVFLFVLVLVFCFGLFSSHYHKCSLDEQEIYKTPCHAGTIRVPQLGQTHTSGLMHKFQTHFWKHFEVQF